MLQKNNVKKNSKTWLRNVLFIVLRDISSLSLVISFSQCEPAAEPYRQFIVHRGDHYAFPKLTETLQSRVLIFDARFNESAIYYLGEQSIQCSRNKLMGFCDCNAQVHENSARFAWFWYQDQLKIYAYCYVNGEVQEQFVGVADIGKYNRYEIELAKDQYIFRLDDNPPVYMKRGNNCTAGTYFKLWPYFGGRATAPHDITIDIKSIY